MRRIRSKKPPANAYISAVLDRDSGMPYPDVLGRYGVDANQFSMALTRDLGEIIKGATGRERQTLEEIASDPDRVSNLFDMGEEFVREQYDDVRSGEQKRFYDGTLKHPENVKSLVYYALISNHPELGSNSRTEVIEGIKNLSTNLKKHFVSLGLGGLMNGAFEKGKRGSPLAVLEVFDEVYQRKTGDASLFDLMQKNHLHRWGG